MNRDIRSEYSASLLMVAPSRATGWTAPAPRRAVRLVKPSILSRIFSLFFA